MTLFVHFVAHNAPMSSLRTSLALAVACALAAPTAAFAEPLAGEPAGGANGTTSANTAATATDDDADISTSDTSRTEVQPQAAGQPSRVSGPHVSNNRTKATYSYAGAIRESVSIQAPFDSDNDGRNDTLVLDIVRPKEMADQGIKAPVVMVASPYFTSLGRGPRGEKKQYDRAKNLTQFPLWYDNYFVERGYAVVALDIVGTGRSNGCSDIGGKYDIGSVTAAINWLNGSGRATYLAGGRGTATANWSTGSVGMIGKSYDGTVANGAAATGVRGLRTIVPINAISSWYDYTRVEGITYRSRYMGRLGQIVTNNKRKCSRIHQNITRATDASNGMNDAWRERDYVKDARNVKSSVLLVHGQHDFNVFMNNAGKWHKALAKNNVPTSMYLTQAEHTDPFDIDRKGWVDYLHTWFDHWLSGLPTGVMDGATSRVEHQLNTFTPDRSWPVGANKSLPLADGIVGESGSTATIRSNRSRTSRLLADPSSKHSERVMYLSQPLSRDVRVSGQSTVTMRVRTRSRSLPLTVKLVDYGRAERYAKNVKTSQTDCWGGETRTDKSCYRVSRNSGRQTDYGVIGSGWLNAAYRNGLDRAESIPRGQWFEVTVPVMASDNVLKAGHRFGIAVYTADSDLRGNVRSRGDVDIDLKSLRFNGTMVNGDVVAGDSRPGRVDAVEEDTAHMQGIDAVTP